MLAILSSIDEQKYGSSQDPWVHQLCEDLGLGSYHCSLDPVIDIFPLELLLHTDHKLCSKHQGVWSLSSGCLWSGYIFP